MNNEENKLDIYQIVWLFFLGCLIGYFIETFFYIIKYGYYVNKQGLVFGPFKPIYGTGAVLVVYFFQKLRRKKVLDTFFMGVVVGTIFEYLCSFLLEVIFKSYFWDYSSFKYNLNGRIYLPYCIIWGVIALILIYGVYPQFLKTYNFLKKQKYFNIFTKIIGMFFIINLVLTGVVLLRQGYRENDNPVFKIIDNYYPEEKIQEKFPKFRPIK